VKKTAAAASALAVGAFATSAKAQDGATHDWTGFYIGAGAGLAASDSDWRIDGGEGFTADEDGPADSDESTGGVAIHGGYNYQIGHLVVGGATDYTYTDIDDSTRFDGGEGANLRTKVNQFGTVRARVGYAMDRVLFFAGGGLALSDQKNTYDSDGSPSTEHDSQTVGWCAGGGIEVAVDQKVSFILEGIFSSFDGEGVAEGPFFDDRFTVDTDITLARLGVNFRF
jgi:outer membrane immunogenic protein